MPRQNRLIRGISAYVAIALMHLLRVLPMSFCRALMLGIGRIAFHMVPRIRRVGMSNLDLVYGDALAREEKLRLLRGSVDNLALVAAELTHVTRLCRNPDGRFCELQGLDTLQAIGTPLIISAHMGNWEVIAATLSANGIKMAEVVREFDHPALNRAVDRLRTCGGVETIPKHHAAPRILSCLREGRAVGVLIDQSPRENGMPATFLGKKCWATIAPAMIAQRSKAPVVPLTVTRKPDRNYLVEIHPPIPMQHTGDLLDDLQVNTQRCQDAIDRAVRAHPEQWLWLHRRWRERPRLEEEWAARQVRRRKDTAATPTE